MSMKEEMERAEAAHAERMKRMRERADAEQRKVDAKILAALREDHEVLAEQLEAAARADLKKAKAKRSANARAAAVQRQAPTEPVAATSSHGDADARRYEHGQLG